MKIIITDPIEVLRLRKEFAGMPQKPWLWFAAEVRWAPTPDGGLEIMVDKVDRESRNEQHD